MIPVHRIHELVRLGRITAAEGADILGMQRKLQHDDQLISFFGVGWVLTALVLIVTLASCGDNVPPPEPDAGITATLVGGLPTACLPWPCPDVDAGPP